MKKIFIPVSAALIFVATFILLLQSSPVKASENPNCNQPTDHAWSWVPQDWGGYWHFGPVTSTNSITITIPTHIWFVDYYNGVTLHGETGDVITNVMEASAFCFEATATPSPTASPTPTITPSPTPTQTPTVYHQYLALLLLPMPPAPPQAQCDWPSPTTDWKWVKNMDGSESWHIGPLAKELTITVPAHIETVYSSLHGNPNPAAQVGVSVTFHEATAFCVSK